MKIAFFEVKDYQVKYFKKKLKGNKLYFFSEAINEKNIEKVKEVQILGVFIGSKVDKKVFDKLKKLKAVVTMSTGFDHIDIKEAKKKKVKVCTVPDYGQNTVAEHAFALILSLSRKINKAYDRTVKGNFSLEGLKGFDLKGKTLGIVGMGSIGKHVARIAKGFEMKVLAYDPFPNKQMEKKFKFKYVPLNKLLKESDIVTLNCPYNKKTRYIINARNIRLMKNEALLINTARGGLVDTGALVKALAKKKIGGAGLDVLEEENMIKEEAELLNESCSREKMENLIQDHMLLNFDNVIITPHMAFYSEEALKRIMDTTFENIDCVLKNKICENEVKVK